MTQSSSANSDPANSANANSAQQYLAHLRRMERRPLADLVYFQARRLEALVRHARQHVPFYQNRFDVAFDANDYLDLSRWHEVPIATRAQVEANSDALKSAVVPESAGASVPDRTSGTGGSVFYFERSVASVVAAAGQSMRIFIDHGFDVSARFADIRIDPGNFAQYPQGQTRPDWTFEEGGGDYVLLDINTETDNQVAWLLRRKPGILFTWASNARRLALAVEQAGEALALKHVATSADKCTPGVRADCKRVFGCEPVDILGVRELGIIAFACNEADVFHMAAESVFVEVLDEAGRPARPGEPGRVVGTDLYNFHMPFIRYSTGDYVTLAEKPCACGRALPAISAFNGRETGRFRRRDGTLVFPEIPEAELDRLIGPLAWQIVQTGAGQLELRVLRGGIDVGSEGTALLGDILSRAVGETVGLRLVAAAPDAGIPMTKQAYFVRKDDR